MILRPYRNVTDCRRDSRCLYVGGYPFSFRLMEFFLKRKDCSNNVDLIPLVFSVPNVLSDVFLRNTFAISSITILESSCQTGLASKPISGGSCHAATLCRMNIMLSSFGSFRGISDARNCICSTLRDRALFSSVEASDHMEFVKKTRVSERLCML